MNSVKHIILSLFGMLLIASCGLYSFTGAAIEGETINIHFIENKSRNVSPSLSATFTEKLRQHITSLSSLALLDNETTDYDLKGNITQYAITVASIQGNETSAKNRLTMTVSIEFKNRMDSKKDYTQTFSRFADFDATNNFQTVENVLIEEITDQLKDDIFNKSFVNW